MSYVVKTRETNAIVCLESTVEGALVADSCTWLRVDATTYASVLELAKARCEADPEHSTLPETEERYVQYKTKAGKMMICEVVRLTHPDAEGYPQLVELVNPGKPDGSFIAQARSCKPVDLSTLNPALVNALLQGDAYEENGGGNTPKLKHGLRK